MASISQPQDNAVQPFRELRSWIDQQLMAKGLHPGPLQTRREAAELTIAHIDQLKNDIATLIRLEGKRSFWSGFTINTLFFVLGIGAGAAMDFIKAGIKWPF